MLTITHRAIGKVGHSKHEQHSVEQQYGDNDVDYHNSTGRVSSQGGASNQLSMVKKKLRGNLAAADHSAVSLPAPVLMSATTGGGNEKADRSFRIETMTTQLGEEGADLVPGCIT
jgi:hypothetical protein